MVLAQLTAGALPVSFPPWDSNPGPPDCESPDTVPSPMSNQFIKTLLAPHPPLTAQPQRPQLLHFQESKFLPGWRGAGIM